MNQIHVLGHILAAKVYKIPSWETAGEHTDQCGGLDSNPDMKPRRERYTMYITFHSAVGDEHWQSGASSLRLVTTHTGLESGLSCFHAILTISLQVMYTGRWTWPQPHGRAAAAAHSPCIAQGPAWLLQEYNSPMI